MAHYFKVRVNPDSIWNNGVQEKGNNPNLFLATTNHKDDPITEITVDAGDTIKFDLDPFGNHQSHYWCRLRGISTPRTGQNYSNPQSSGGSVTLDQAEATHILKQTPGGTVKWHYDSNKDTDNTVVNVDDNLPSGGRQQFFVILEIKSDQKNEDGEYHHITVILDPILKIGTSN